MHAGQGTYVICQSTGECVVGLDHLHHRSGYDDDIPDAIKEKERKNLLHTYDMGEMKQ
jgi:hypothetical protein